MRSAREVAKGAWVRFVSLGSWLLKGSKTKTLRRLLVLSGLIQLVLAPLTSWASDTPNFAVSVLGFLYVGSPYSLNIYYNPPLAAFLQLPLFALLGLFSAPQQIVHTVPVLVPFAGEASGISSVLVSPAGLLALKLPLIIFCLATGIGIYYLAGKLQVKGHTQNLIAAAWLLNPLVIWATAVHAEVDVLAAFFTVAFLVSLYADLPLTAGIALGFGFFAKGFPIFLVPVGLAFFLSRTDPANVSGTRPSVIFIAGLLLSLLPFIPFISNLETVLLGLYPSSAFGGVSLLALFNPTLFLNGTDFDRFFSPSNGLILHIFFIALVGIAIVSAPLIFAWRSRQNTPEAREGQLKSACLVTLWVATSTILLSSSPQPENLLAILPLLVLTVPSMKRVSWSLFAALSGAGWGLYLALLTPFAYFFPLAALLGTGALQKIGTISVAYSTNHVVPPQDLWTLVAVIGGLAVLLTWLVCVKEFLSTILRDLRVRRSEHAN
jgi:hypothetical protein